MSRLFSGTPFDKPMKCEICGKPEGTFEGGCRCIKSALPEKKKMGERPGGKLQGKASGGFVATPQNSDPPKDQVARVQEEKRKGNRFVTVITGLEHPANDLAEICTMLKGSLGAGGSVQGRTVEIQGEHAKAVGEWLTEEGYRVRVI